MLNELFEFYFGQLYQVVDFIFGLVEVFQIKSIDGDYFDIIFVVNFQNLGQSFEVEVMVFYCFDFVIFGIFLVVVYFESDMVWDRFLV